MAVVLTFVVRIRDWKRLQALSRDTLIGRAREVGATQYQIYRSTTDAAELLLMAELPDHDAACEMRQTLYVELAGLLASRQPDDRLWEACGWESLA